MNIYLATITKASSMTGTMKSGKFKKGIAGRINSKKFRFYFPVWFKNKCYRIRNFMIDFTIKI